MKEKHESMRALRATARALLLLAAFGLPGTAEAEAASDAARANGAASEPAAASLLPEYLRPQNLLPQKLFSESLLPENLFNNDSLFGRLAERVHFSGFARLVGGYLDEGDASYQGYDNAISYDQHSLFALQTDVALTETFSFTTQLLAHASKDRDTGLEWAYLTWRPSSNWNFKAGKLRTPFLFHSDTLDLGYAYPWIIPPQQVYTPYLFPNFTGLGGAYQFNIWDWDIEAEAYWGRIDNFVVKDEYAADTEVSNPRGLILDAWRGNLRLRASWHLSDTELKLPQAGFLGLVSDNLVAELREQGFNRSADSLRAKSSTTFTQLAISYDALDYFLKAEYTRLRRTNASAVPEFDSYYLSGGYTFHPFNLPITAHASFASISTKGRDRPVEDEIECSPGDLFSGLPGGLPGGLPLPAPSPNCFYRALYLGAFDYIRSANSPLDDDLRSLSVGLRWDVNPAVALKAEWVHLRGAREQRGFFTIDPMGDFDRKANLFLLGLEWVF